MYKKRREQLARAMQDNSIALIFSGNAPYKTADEKYEFSVNRNFYYLTGLDKENMVLALLKCNNKVSETLFIEPYDEMMAKWVGGRMLPDEAADISDICNIETTDEMMNSLHRWMQYGLDHQKNIYVYADLSKQEADQITPAITFCNKFKANYPQVIIANLYEEITQLRLIKDEVEIEELKEAIEVTRQGIYSMMANAEAGMGENQIEAYFDFELKSNNCKHSFPSIVASGRNATVLHYAENNCYTEEDDLVLCDLGAASEYMNADITRTFPVSGKFTPRQRQIYEIVLKTNKAIIEMIKPGYTLRELNQEVLRIYATELKAIGLLENGKKVTDYYWHGVSHMLGLDTHDVSLSNYKIKPGNVFTVEPGLYLEEEGIGIRIEDDVLVTEDGCINLSESIIKEIDDIEAFMQACK